MRVFPCGVFYILHVNTNFIIVPLLHPLNLHHTISACCSISAKYYPCVLQASQYIVLGKKPVNHLDDLCLKILQASQYIVVLCKKPVNHLDDLHKQCLTYFTNLKEN